MIVYPSGSGLPAVSRKNRFIASRGRIFLCLPSLFCQAGWILASLVFSGRNSLKLVSEAVGASPVGGGGGVLPEKLGRGVRPASQNPYPIYVQNLRFSLPYI